MAKEREVNGKPSFYMKSQNGRTGQQRHKDSDNGSSIPGYNNVKLSSFDARSESFVRVQRGGQVLKTV